MSDRWYYQMLMEEFGPVTLEQVRELLEDGTLSPDDLIRQEGSDDWIQISETPFESDAADTLADISDLSELSFEFEESSSPGAPVSEYFVLSLGQVLGPMTSTELAEMAASGSLSATDQIRPGAEGAWMPASELAELSGAFSAESVTEKNSVSLTSATQKRLGEQALSNLTAPPPPAPARKASPEPKPNPDTANPPGENDSTPASRKSATGLKKKKVRKGEDQLLNEIFDEVFAEEPKAPRSSPGSRSTSNAAVVETPTGNSEPAAAPEPVSSAPPAPPTWPGPAPVNRPSPAPRPMPKPSRSGSGFSFDGPVKYGVFGAAGLGLVAVLWMFVLPLLSGNNSNYARRMNEAMVEYDRLGAKPTEAAWKAYSEKTRAEFTGYYKLLLDSGASRPQDEACRAALKSFVDLVARPHDDLEGRTKCAAEVKNNLVRMFKQ